MFSANHSQKVIRLLEMPREPLHKIWMRSNQWLIRYRAHKLFRWLFFSKCPPSAILFLVDSSQKVIRSSEVPRKPPRQIWLQSNQRFIRYRANKLFGYFFNKSSVSHLVLNIFFPKVNQIIWITQRTPTSNLNAIQPTVQMVSLFGPIFFSKCPPSAILFLMNYSQKFIRSSEIPREPPIKFELNPFKG